MMRSEGGRDRPVPDPSGSASGGVARATSAMDEGEGAIAVRMAGDRWQSAGLIVVYEPSKPGNAEFLKLWRIRRVFLCCLPSCLMNEASG